MWFLYHMFNSVTMYYLIWLLEFSYINVHTYFFLVLQTFSILEYCFCNNRLLSNLCLCLLCELFMVLATTCLVFYWAFYCQYFWPLYSVPANTRRSEFHVYLFFLSWNIPATIIEVLNPTNPVEVLWLLTFLRTMLLQQSSKKK